MEIDPEFVELPIEEIVRRYFPNFYPNRPVVGKRYIDTDSETHVVKNITHILNATEIEIPDSSLNDIFLFLHKNSLQQQTISAHVTTPRSDTKTTFTVGPQPLGQRIVLLAEGEVDLDVSIQHYGSHAITGAATIPQDQQLRKSSFVSSLGMLSCLVTVVTEPATTMPTPVFCAGFGRALDAHSEGVPYAEYADTTRNEGKSTAMSAMPRIIFDESFYKSLPIIEIRDVPIGGEA